MSLSPHGIVRRAEAVEGEEGRVGSETDGRSFPSVTRRVTRVGLRPRRDPTERRGSSRFSCRSLRVSGTDTRVPNQDDARHDGTPSVVRRAPKERRTRVISDVSQISERSRGQT